MLHKHDKQQLICLQSNVKIKVKFTNSEFDVIKKSTSTIWNQKNNTAHLKLSNLSPALALLRENLDAKSIAKSVLLFFFGWEI